MPQHTSITEARRRSLDLVGSVHLTGGATVADVVAQGRAESGRVRVLVPVVALVDPLDASGKGSAGRLIAATRPSPPSPTLPSCRFVKGAALIRELVRKLARLKYP